MGLFARLFGRRDSEADDLDDLMVQVVEGGAVVLMDRDTYDYTHGNTSGSDPCQSDLDQILAETTRIRVYAGGTCRGKRIGAHQLMEIDEPKAIEELSAALRINTHPDTFGHCGCLGGPSLEFYADSQLLAIMAVHHGRSLRWGKWRPDARLLREQAITYWFVKHGMHLGLVDWIYRNEYLVLWTVPKSLPGFNRKPSVEKQLHDLAEAVISSFNVEGARVVSGLLVEDFPRSWRAYLCRARAGMLRQDHEACIADCDAGLTLAVEPENQTNLLLHRALAKFELGEGDLGVSDFSAVLAVSPAMSMAYYKRGIARSMLGQMAEALEDAQSAVRLQPDQPECLDAQAYMLLVNGHYDSCVDVCNSLIEGRLRPIAEQTGNYARAIFWRSKAIERAREPTRYQADLSNALQLHEELMAFLDHSMSDEEGS